MAKNIPGDDVPEELNLLNHNDNLGWRGRRVSTRRPKPEIRSTGMAELGIKKNVQFLDELIVHEVPQKAAAYQGFLVCERDPLFVNPIPDATPVQTLYGLTTLIHTARIDGTFARLNEAYRGLGLEHLVGIITTPDRMDAAEKAGDIIVQEYFNTAVCVLPVGTDQIKVVGSAERINDWVQKHGFALVQKKTSHSSKTSARIGGWTVLGLDALSDPAFAEQHIGPHGYDWVIANSIAEHDGWQSEDNFQPATRDSEVRRRPASDLLGVTLEHSLTYTTKLPVTSIPQHAKDYHAFLVASRNVFGDEQQRILYGLRPLAERADIHRLDIENGMQHIIDTGSLPIALFATPEQVSRIADKKKQATSIHRTSRYIRVLPTTTHEITPQGVSHTRVHQDTSALKLVLPRLREPFGKHAIYAADQLDVQLTERYVGGPLDFIIAKELYVPAERVDLPVLDSVFSDTDTDFPAIQDTNTTGEQTMTDENQEHRTSDPNMSRAHLPADLNRPKSKVPGLSEPLGGAAVPAGAPDDAFSGSDSGAFKDPELTFASNELAPAVTPVPTDSTPPDEAPPFSTGDLFNQVNPFAEDPAMQGFSDTPPNSDPLGPLLDTERRTRDEVASASASVVPEADDGFPNVEIEAEQPQGFVMRPVDPSKPLTTRRLKGRQETMRREAPASTSQIQPALDTDEAVRLAANATADDLPELGANDKGDTVYGAGSTVPPVVKVVVSADDENITEATLIERPTGRLPAHTMEAGGAVTPADESQTDADAISSDAADRLARLYQLFEGKFESLEGRMGSLENKVNKVDSQTTKPKKGFMRRTAGLVGKYVVLPAALLAAGVLSGVYIDRHKQTANNVLNETAVPVVQQFEEWTGTQSEPVSAKQDPVLAEVAQLRELIAKYDGNKIDARKLDELSLALEEYANQTNLDAIVGQQQQHTDRIMTELGSLRSSMNTLGEQTQTYAKLNEQLAEISKQLAQNDTIELAKQYETLTAKLADIDAKIGSNSTEQGLAQLRADLTAQLNAVQTKLAEDKSEQLAQQYEKLEQTLSTLSANIERTRGDLTQMTDSLRQAAQGTQLEQIGKQYEQLAQAMDALTEELKKPTDYTALEERIEGVSKQLEEAAALDRQSNEALNGVAGQQGQVTQALRELSDALRDKLPSAELGQKLDRALALLEQSSQPVQPSNIVTYRGVLQFSDEETHQGAVHFAESLKASRPDSTVTPEFYILLMDARGNKNGVVDMNELKAEILYRLQERNFAYTPGKANVRGTVRRYEQSMGRPSDDLLARVDEVMDTPAWKGFAMETLRQLFEESLDKGYYTTMRVGEKDVLLLTQKGVEIFAQETERRVHRYLSE